MATVRAIARSSIVAQLHSNMPKVMIVFQMEMTKICNPNLPESRGLFGLRGGCYIALVDLGSKARGSDRAIALRIFTYSTWTDTIGITVLTKVPIKIVRDSLLLIGKINLIERRILR